MRRTRIALCALVPFIGARAQGAFQNDVAGVLNSGNGALCRSALNLTVRSQWRGASIALLPAPVSSATSYGMQSPVVAFGVRTPDGRPWRVEASGAIGNAEGDCAALSAWSRQWIQVSRSFRNGGVSIAAGGRSLSSLDPSKDQEGLTLGAWRKVRGARVSLDIREHQARSNGTLVAIDTSYRRDGPLTAADTTEWRRHIDTSTVSTAVQRRAFDIRTRVQFSIGRFAFDVTGGSTIGHWLGSAPANTLTDSAPPSASGSNRNRNVDAFRTQLWGRVDARLPLASFADLQVGVAALPARPLPDSPIRGVWSLGFALSRWSGAAAASKEPPVTAIAFETVREDSTRVIFRFRAPNALMVQMSGEPTAWSPVTMTKVDATWWEAKARVTPGIYRVNISIDGGPWQPPPGVPAVRDEFGGSVGLVTVR